MRTLLLIPILLLGCSSTPPKTTLVDNKNTTRTTIYWNNLYLQQMTQEIVSEIQRSKLSKSKIYAFGKIRNETHQAELNTREITHKIMTILLEDGYKFIADYDEENPKSHIDAIFKGILSSIYSQDEHQKRLTFRLELHLTDPITSKIISEYQEVEVQSTSTKKLFGW